MRVMDVVNEAKGAMRASEVFGTPYEKNGVTIIPAAKIAGGAGGGGDEGQPQAGGGGLGVSSRPGCALGVKSTDVSWQPALDLHPVIPIGPGGAILALPTPRTLLTT